MKKIFLYGLLSIVFLSFVKCKKDKIKGKEVKIKALFDADETIINPGDSVSFSDSTTGFPLTWRWTFEGGTPATSNIQNPTVVYKNLGEFSVTLHVTNAYGEDELTKKSYIKVERVKILPEIEVIDVFNIKLHSAQSGGTLIREGSMPVTEMGVCWNTTGSPKVTDSKAFTTDIVEDELTGDGWESFVISMENLDQEGTAYFYRAYAINGDGVGYSKVLSFIAYERDTCDEITHNSFVDVRDNQSYDYVRIAGMDIMAQNLNYNISGQSWCYDDKSENCQLYGRLYTRDAALSACPTGWHLTTEAEWNTIVQNIGQNEAGKKLKKKNVWDYKRRGSNEFCFSAYPTGYKNLQTGRYVTKDFYAYWWTPSVENTKFKVAALDNESDLLNMIALDNEAYSVRCIKDK